MTKSQAAHARTEAIRAIHAHYAEQKRLLDRYVDAEIAGVWDWFEQNRFMVTKGGQVRPPTPLRMFVPDLKP